jgi:hypothetical protein
MSDSDEYIYSTEEEEAEDSSESDVEPGINTDAGIETKTTPPTSTATPTNAWQLVSEMTGLSANAAADLLEIAQGDVHKACALHFGSNDLSDPFNSLGSETTVDQCPQCPPWHLVAEMTGLSLKDAQQLYDSTGGDVETAVMLHFEGAEAVMAGNNGRHSSSGLVGKSKRRRHKAEEQLRAAAGASYDAFDAYTEPTKKINRRRAKKLKEKQQAAAAVQQQQHKQRGGFAHLGSDSDTSSNDSGEEEEEK